MYIQPAIPTKIESQKAYRSIETTSWPSAPIWSVEHSITAYQVRRAFMATNTAAITTMAAMPTLRACLASDTTANWAAMA